MSTLPIRTRVTGRLLKTSSENTNPGGLHCCCTVLDSASEGNRCICLGAALEEAEVRFEASLTDSKGRHTGVFQAGGGKGRELSKYEREVMEVGTGLANLAVNQRRMYQELNYTSTHDQLTALPS